MTGTKQIHAADPTSALFDPEFAEAVKVGLWNSKNKSLPCKFFYDREGSDIFEEICQLPEYYPTRTELNIIRSQSDQIAGLCRSNVAVVELGSGRSTKTRLILNSLRAACSNVTYFPIDISSTTLQSTVSALQLEYPTFVFAPINDEYDIGLRQIDCTAFDTFLVLWLGTSIGNVEKLEAESILRNIHEIFKAKALIVLGVDLKKDRAVLEQAYNDLAGVTARFNLNILARINRELGGHFDLTSFEHRAIYNEKAGRIEMRLVSSIAQTVPIDELNISIDFDPGETIHTENSYKFTQDEIAQLALRSGLTLLRHWCDDNRFFSVNVLRP
jgi:dimethylhistidine N-methyltransferase